MMNRKLCALSLFGFIAFELVISNVVCTIGTGSGSKSANVQPDFGLKTLVSARSASVGNVPSKSSVSTQALPSVKERIRLMNEGKQVEIAEEPVEEVQPKLTAEEKGKAHVVPNPPPVPVANIPPSASTAIKKVKSSAKLSKPNSTKKPSRSNSVVELKSNPKKHIDIEYPTLSSDSPGTGEETRLHKEFERKQQRERRHRRRQSQSNLSALEDECAGIECSEYSIEDENSVEFGCCAIPRVVNYKKASKRVEKVKQVKQ